MDTQAGIVEITPIELALRWRKTVGTLKVWRCRGFRPKYNKRGHSVTYSISDIMEYEAQNKIIPCVK